MIRRVLAWGPVAFASELVQRYLHCGAPRAAAALSYFLVLTLFPLLIFVNYAIGLFHLDLEQLLTSLDQLLPRGTLAVMQEYLRYVAQNQSQGLVLAAAFTILVSASAGLRTLFDTMDHIYGVDRDASVAAGVRRILYSVVLSALLLVTVYLSVVVIFTGDWFFGLLLTALPDSLVRRIPLQDLSGLWQWMRYLLLFCFMMLLLMILYRAGAPKRCRRPSLLLLSATVTSLVLVVASAVFSWFIGLSSRYDLVYGSLASLILLLVWLYLCGCIVVLGAVLGRMWAQRLKFWS